jgi:signal transduction histidine kinase
MAVTDDGRGFRGVLDLDRLESAGHLGLAGMRERIGVVGGAVELGEEEGGGARVEIWVPAEEG